MLNHYGKTASFTTKVSGAGGGAACGGRGAAPCAPEPRRPAGEPLEDQSPRGSSSGLPRPSRPGASARRHVQSHLAPALPPGIPRGPLLSPRRSALLWARRPSAGREAGGSDGSAGGCGSASATPGSSSPALLPAPSPAWRRWPHIYPTASSWEGPARVSGAYGYPLGTGWVEDDVGVRAEAGCCPQGSPWGLYVLRSLWPLATFTAWVTPAGSPG